MIHSDYFNAHSLGNYLSIVRAFAKPGTPAAAAAAAPLPADDPRFALGGGRPCVLSESEWTPTIAAVKVKCDALSGALQANGRARCLVCRARYHAGRDIGQLRTGRIRPAVGFVMTGRAAPYSHVWLRWPSCP